MPKTKTITVKGADIFVYQNNMQDFISLTNIARFRDNERSDYILQNWMRNCCTIELKACLSLKILLPNDITFE